MKSLVKNFEVEKHDTVYSIEPGIELHQKVYPSSSVYLSVHTSGCLSHNTVPLMCIQQHES